MSYTKEDFTKFLRTIPGFDQLGNEEINQLVSPSIMQPLRYTTGAILIGKEQLPERIIILYQGNVRLLGYDPQSQLPITLKLLEPGAIIGEISWLRQIPCETAIASTDPEIICLTFQAEDYLELLAKNRSFGEIRQHQSSLIEIFDLISPGITQQALGNYNLKEITQQAILDASIHYLPPGKHSLDELSREKLWFISSNNIPGFTAGTLLENTETSRLVISGKQPMRLVGINREDLEISNIQKTEIEESESNITIAEVIDIPYAEDTQFVRGESTAKAPKKPRRKYPFFHGEGEVNSALACFQMLAKHSEIPLRKEVIKRILEDSIRRNGSISFPICAYVAELIGLKGQFVDIPTVVINRIPTPALISYGDSYAVVYEVDANTVVLGVPSQGIIYRTPAELTAELTSDESSLQPQIKVLLLSTTKETPQQRFGLSWFLPYLSRYRRVLIEVFIASFFVQLAALANPLVLQLIIDKVIVQNSINTLNILGLLLLAVALFEAVLTTLRTYLFVDTTNRIDMSLGSQIIDHLLRLPLRYFDPRPVGELSTRINELENIRQFLTGTALTVVLDALFSGIYIVVMLFYSWQLTLVAVSTIPIFVLVTLVAAPTMSRQLRTKAERNASTQSYLVEVMSGIQTVKAQNIEFRSRSSWQKKYAQFVAAGFKTVITSTLASSTSQFLSKLSALLVLWVGAYLVLQKDLTLGELIAFRIISGYVTTPILRLAQIWQTFQETGLSLERLSDIVDTPQEAEIDRNNIALPPIIGAVKYDNVCFRFKPSGPLQLTNVSLEFKAGQFIGIVGQSGSGKSTMMKLLLRLYDVESGRILIDDYDISKVELYSLRRQIGVVPQDTLLFDGTVEENIALTNPEATTEQIIAAAKIAVAHDFIMGLPNGYNTRVGEKGSSLSGGQRQRIAIARSVLQKPKLLVLDEATSALDYPTEKQICLNLAQAFKGSTVFFITHRLNTVSNADTIVVMDNSRVLEQGTHQQLMAEKGHYYYLYKQQEAIF